MTASERTVRRRQAALVAALGAVLLLLGFAVQSCGDDEPEATPTAAEQRDTQRSASRPQLPGGGRRLFPDRRVVGIFGAPQDDELGALGIGTPAQAGRRLQAIARPYRKYGRRVLPAMELLATIANAAPGADGLYRTRQTDAVIRRYLRAARRVDAILILDIQPGYADFLAETRALDRWLREPDVSLALDPEWKLPPGQVPGQAIGSVSFQEVNAVSAYLEQVIRRHRLPQKLLLVHRFTDDMLRPPGRLKQRRDVAVTVNVDGFGGREIKTQKYEGFADRPPPTRSPQRSSRFYNGFKLFFREDVPRPMSPRQVMALRPRPDVVVYE